MPNEHNAWVETPMRVEGELLKVQDLINSETREWDDAILSRWLKLHDSALVKHVPMGMFDYEDYLEWCFEANGAYYVRSGYQVACEPMGENGNGGWKNIWSLDIPGKVKGFLWRTCKELLPTCKKLCQKRVVEDARFPVCRFVEEDALHAVVGYQGGHDLH